MTPPGSPRWGWRGQIDGGKRLEIQRGLVFCGRQDAAAKWRACASTKVAVKDDVVSARPQPTILPYAPFEPLRDARAIIQHEAKALSTLASRLNETFVEAVSLIAACQGVVVVTGVGKAGLIGQKLTATLSSTGTRAIFLDPVAALHGDLGCVGRHDLVLALSNSGETEELLRLLPSLEQMKVPLVAITASRHSRLGCAATLTIELGPCKEAGLHGLAPTTSTTAMLALGDALALVVSERKEFTPAQFALFHPAGSLGKRLTSVKELMRPVEQVRVAVDTTTVRDVFVQHATPGRRSGAVMLVDADGLLTGIFTDSDLARLLERRRLDAFERPIAEVMTCNPLTIEPDALLEEVFQLLGERRISELPVLDKDGRPVGLVDITDVVGLGAGRDEG